MAEVTGHCLCGSLRYETDAPPIWSALCHCESCRRACSAPVVAWMGFPEETVRWTGERRFYQSSEHATRSFCPTCGTQMSFASANWPGEMHLYGVSRDDPAAYAPDLHCHYSERLSWLHIEDHLPKWSATAGSDKVNTEGK